MFTKPLLLNGGGDANISSGLYTITYPASLSNQTLSVTVNNKDTIVTSNNVTYREMAINTYNFSVTANQGYEAGTILIDGVDQNTTSISDMTINSDIVITVNPAIELSSDCVFRGYLTVGQYSSNYGYQPTYNIGSLEPSTTFSYTNNNSSYSATISSIILYDDSRSFIAYVNVPMKIVFDDTYTDNTYSTNIGTPSGIGLYNYFISKYNSGEKIKVEIFQQSS